MAGAATEDRALLGRTDRAAGLAAAVAVAASSAEPVGQAELAGLAVMEATVTGAATQETAAMVAGSASAGHHPISSLVRAANQATSVLVARAAPEERAAQAAQGAPEDSGAAPGLPVRPVPTEPRVRTGRMEPLGTLARRAHKPARISPVRSVFEGPL